MEPLEQKVWCGELRCVYAEFEDGGWVGCKKGHDEVPVNEDGDYDCDDYKEAWPDDYEEDNYDGRELE